MSVAKHGVELVAKTASRAAAALPVNTDWQVGKFQNQLPEIQEDAGVVERTLRKMYYTKINYPRLGMLQDDMKYEKKSYVQAVSWFGFYLKHTFKPFVESFTFSCYVFIPS